MQRALGLGEDRAVETGDVAHGEHIERGVVVVVFQRGGRRQDEIRVPRGLVDVQVDADHELQPLKRGVKLTAVGRRQYRVASDRNQRLDLPLPRGQHFLGQRRNRQLAAVLRQLRDAALPAIEAASRGRSHQIQRGLGTQRTACTVKIAGDQIDQLHQPVA